MGDSDRLAQVLRNLVQNALEHTGPGGLVRVSASGRGDRVRIAVDDDGPGIPAGERELIFDRFHRTDFSRNRRGGGAVSASRLCGRSSRPITAWVWAEASPEGGARIVFELPRFEAR